MGRGSTGTHPRPRDADTKLARSRDTAWFAILDRDWPDLRAAHRRWLDPANFDAEGRQILRLSDLTAPLGAAAAARAHSGA